MKAAALQVPAFDWSGVYVGVHAGYGGGMKDWIFPGFEPTVDYAANGFLAGGQAGINKQIASLVFGLELDGSWANIRGSQPLQTGFPYLYDLTSTSTSRIEALTTVAGRAGLAADRWFVFAKGGLAGAWEKHSAVRDFGSGVVTSNQSGREHRWAPMVGFGAEYALDGNWSIKAEYDYIHFGTRPVAMSGNATLGGVTIPISTDMPIAQDSIHLIKVGANYRLGGVAVDPKYPPVKAVPGTNWTGGFVGVQAGYGFGHELRNQDTGTFPDLSGGLDVSGWLGGFDGGVNVQSGVFVLGLEGEWMWTGIRGSRTSAFPAGPLTETTNLKTSIDWLAIASGRAGFVVGDRLLAYGKAGVAIANESHPLNGTASTGGPFSIAIALEGKAVHSGVVIGAGLEYALAGNWSIKGEYDYIRMINQHTSQSGTYSQSLFAPSAAAVNNWITQNLHLFKLGVNYHFNPLPGAVSARY
ncbi:outer membrane protein [Bradyrhizobium liaoningense]|uniref:outer membrane protein n=1 Tax=Bradyrhizobium liaoningense TaxID=43992 RepID=UPI001BAB638D|nr:outer membrane beta-barrel protein [Bradyrhizobium liaoningense]MBR0719097.1 porin family protein [Bradyrhizobium liaoningense]